MKHWTLQLRQAPALRLDVRMLQPLALAEMSEAAVAALPLFHGHDRTTIGDWFSLSASTADTPTLTLQGDLQRIDRIGCQMTTGLLQVDGNAGDDLGAGLQGGLLRTTGSAGLRAGCEMQGGLLDVGGDVGDFAASAQPGSMDGMRGGVFIVRGSAGTRLADRMRRGSLLVFGNVGDFAASRLVAGTLAIGGTAGTHLGHGMRRGSLLCAGTAPALGPTFNPMQGDLRVIWQLLARDVARLGGEGSPFSRLPSQSPRRFAGDLGAGGKGEVWCA